MPNSDLQRRNTPVWLAAFDQDVAQLRTNWNTSPVRVSFTERGLSWPDPDGDPGALSIFGARNSILHLLAMAKLTVAAAPRNGASAPGIDTWRRRRLGRRRIKMWKITE